PVHARQCGQGAQAATGLRTRRERGHRRPAGDDEGRLRGGREGRVLVTPHLVASPHRRRQASSMALVARLTAGVLDCPDPHALAAFYGELTGWQVEYDEPEWVTLKTGMGLRVCFQ